MRTTLLTAAAVVLSASVAHADFLLGADDNDRKVVINTDAQAEGIASSHAAGIAQPRSGRVSPGFLLGTSANDQKSVVNQYGSAGEAVFVSSLRAPGAAPQARNVGVLLGADDNDRKVWINLSAR